MAATLIVLLMWLAMGDRVAATEAQTAPGDAASSGSARDEPPVRKEDLENPQPVFPPGQEDLLADMLGRGEALAGQCRFAGADADGALLRSTYTCSGGEVVLELRSVDSAPANATRTSQFALVVKSGAPPDGLLADLASRIRAREAGFKWKYIEGPARRFSRRNIILAAGVVGIVLLAFAMRSWLSPRRMRPR